MYTVTITKSGQVTLPKELRDFLGVKPGQQITFDKEKNGVSIHRKLNRDEFFAELDKNISAKTRRLAKKNAGKTVAEMKDEYLRSPAGQRETRMKYAF